MSDSDGDYGPALPPSMKKSRDIARSKSGSSDSSSDENDCMPALPPSMLASKKPARSPNSSLSGRSRKSGEVAAVIGPALPPHLSGTRPVQDEDGNADAPTKPQAKSVPGPTPPASLTKCDGRDSVPDDAAASSSDDDSYGPALPPGFVRRLAAAPPPRVKGPALPPGGLPPAEDSEEEGDVIGPLPPKAEVDLEQYAAADVERRASSMKQKLDDAARPVVHTREEWMLSLPPERAGEFGLGPRQFRRTTPAERGDTSVWTEVGGAEARPAAKPASKQKPEVDLAVRRRDEEMAEVAEKLKKGRKDSLFDMHQKKVKRAKKEEGSEPGRRQEFDRERDLATNRFDDAQRRAAIKRSRGASDMFSSGAQKYL